MICIYHRKDLDGYTSGAIVKKYNPSVKLIGWDYGDKFPLIPNDEKEVVMCDISFPMDIMYEIYKKVESFIWIDHHASAIKDYKEFSEENNIFFEGLREIGKAACELTLEYFFPEDALESVTLLGSYDVWRGEGQDIWNEDIMPFQYGMRLRVKTPEDYFKKENYDLLEDREAIVKKVKEEGKRVFQYVKNENERMCKENAFVVKFEGLRTLCVNKDGGSAVFTSIYDEKLHDMMLTFIYCGKKNNWNIGIYSTKETVDCSKIAKKYEGGGHKAASGFRMNSIDFLNIC